MLQIYDKFTNYTNYRVTKCFSSYAKNLSVLSGDFVVIIMLKLRITDNENDSGL